MVCEIIAEITEFFFRFFNCNPELFGQYRDRVALCFDSF